MKGAVTVWGKPLVLAICVSLAACSSTFVKGSQHAKGSGNPLKISQDVWKDYQAYLQKIGEHRPGAFAVSLDGKHWGSVTCRSNICGGSMTYSNDAISQCQLGAPDCIVFSKRDEIVVDYEIVD